MSKEKESLIRGIFNYSISSWVNIVVGFLSVIIATRIIEPDAYGIISIFLSTSNLLMYIMTFGMDGAFIRFYNDPPVNNSKNQLLYRILIFSTFIGCILSVLVVGPLSDVASDYVFGMQSRKLVVILILYTYSQAIFRFLNISFRMGFKTKEYTIQNIVINCFSRVIIILIGALTDNVFYIIGIMGSGMFFLMLIYVYVQRQEIKPIALNGASDYRISLKGYREFLKFALYSAPSYFVTYFNSFMSQGMIKSLLGAFSLGIFTSCGMFRTILSALQGGFSTYWSAYVYKNHKTEKNQIVNMHDYILIFTAICASGLVVFRDVVYIIIGEEYHASKMFFSLLLIPAVLGIIRETTDKGIAISKKNEVLLFSNIISVGLNLVGCYFMTRKYGLIGAAFAEAVSGIVLYILTTIYGQKYYRTIKSPVKSISVTILIVAIMVFPSLCTNITYVILVTLLLDVVVAVIMKKEIGILLNRLIEIIRKKNT